MQTFQSYQEATHSRMTRPAYWVMLLIIDGCLIVSALAQGVVAVLMLLRHLPF